MGAVPKNVSASEFKAKCLALLEDVAMTKLSLVVTKRGKPIAKLVPVEGEEPPSLLGSVHYRREEDLISSEEETWEADQ
jgi:prevent-host-death family protein